MLQLWYQKPATYWEEALPLGNGRLGAMVWSGVDHETLSLNEDSLWSGYPKCADIPGAVEYYKQAQQLAREKKYSEAQELLEDMFLSDYTQSYLPLADLKLELQHPQGDVENYRRSLSLEDAISRLTYTIGGTTYTREAFVSAPDQAIVLRIQADKPGSITLKAWFDCRLRSSCTIEDGRLVLDGVAPSQVDPSYLGETPNPIAYEEDPQKKGMRFCAILEAQAQGGTIHPWEDALEITGADSVTLLVAAQTSFNGPFRQPYLDGKPYKELCLKDLNAAAAQSFEALRQRHMEDYKSYFDRVSMNLGPDEDEVPTVERLARWNEYRQLLTPLERAGKIDLPVVPEGCVHNAHMFYIKTAYEKECAQLREFLKDRDVLAVSHYVPLHSAPAGLKYGRFHGEDVYTTKESERLLRLPMYYGLTAEETAFVAEKVREFYGA